MTRLFAVWRVVLLMLLCLGWGGCGPSGGDGLVEEKDPNYLTGRGRKSALDYAGAIEAFEKALEANPRSAAAHLALGLIYYQNVTTNWARAIYHFERYLELRPKANNADLIRQDIDYSKLALAKEVPYTPSNDVVRKEIEHLARENAELRRQVDQFKAQLAQRPATATNGAAAFDPINTSSAKPLVSDQVAERLAPFSTNETGRPAAAAKTHVVKSGDTPYSIARSYGVKLASLLSANPGVDPRRLRPGQTLLVPLP